MAEMEKYIKEEHLLEHLATDDNALPDSWAMISAEGEIMILATFAAET
jgi:hypothetical protein